MRMVRTFVGISSQMRLNDRTLGDTRGKAMARQLMVIVFAVLPCLMMMHQGLVLDEFLNYDTPAKFVANSATRASGLIIAKDKAAAGLPYEAFTKLFDTVVWPTINYEIAI